MIDVDPEPSDVGALLKSWGTRAKRAAIAHYNVARRLDGRHYIIGGVLVITSAISACLAGRSFFGFPNIIVDSAMAIFSALALSSACVHVFLHDAHRADSYRRTGSRYASIKREIEQLLSGREIGNVPPEILSDVRRKLDVLGEDALPIPHGIWRAAQREFSPGTGVVENIGWLRRGLIALLSPRKGA